MRNRARTYTSNEAFTKKDDPGRSGSNSVGLSPFFRIQNRGFFMGKNVYPVYMNVEPCSYTTEETAVGLKTHVQKVMAPLPPSDNNDACRHVLEHRSVMARLWQ